MNISETTGFATLIVTIITSIFFPFILRPAINYHVFEEAPNEASTNRYRIDIINYGTATAHNVVVSLKSSNGNINAFTSIPYLSSGLTGNVSYGTAFAKIELLPPFGSIVIHVGIDGPVEPADNKLEYVYVGSDEAVGRETEMTVLMAQLLVLFVGGASIAVYWLWKEFISPKSTEELM
jgi:hypothetical protein